MHKPKTPYQPGDAFLKYIQYPDDVLDIAKMFVEYHQGSSDFGKSPIYTGAIKRAKKLLGVNVISGITKDGVTRKLSYLPFGWRRRLETAGIDPDTFQVKNKDRWALCWETLSSKHPYFYPEKLEARISTGDLVPQEQALAPNYIVIAPKDSQSDREERARYHLSDIFKQRVQADKDNMFL